MSWQDKLEEGLNKLSVSTFKNTSVCSGYYENYEDPNYWEEGHEGRKPEPQEIKDEAIGCMLCNLHDMGGYERSEDLARILCDIIEKYNIALEVVKRYEKAIKSK